MHRLALFLALAAAAALSGCGGSSPATPGRAVGTITERPASYRGVRLGMRAETVDVVLGAPLGSAADPYVSQRALPPFLPSDTAGDFVYPDVALTFVRDRVASINVYGQGAATIRGVGVGSSLAEVRAVYPAVRCLPGRGGSDPEDPGCQVTLAPAHYLYFSGDPIALITVSSFPPIPSTPPSAPVAPFAPVAPLAPAAGRPRAAERCRSSRASRLPGLCPPRRPRPPSTTPS